MTWDRTHKWLVHRAFRYESAVAVIFSSMRPSLEELKAARMLRPEFSNEPPAQFRQRIRDGRLTLGVMRTAEAREIAARAASLGLHLDVLASAQESYAFENKTMGTALIVEDDREAQQLAAEMIATGVPVQDQEFD